MVQGASLMDLSESRALSQDGRCNDKLQQEHFLKVWALQFC